MLLVKGLFHHSPDEEVLITCAGDGSVKLWGLDSLPEGLIELDKFKNEGLSALSMTYSDGFLYVGMSDGKAMVCNLDSRQIIQILDVKCADVGAVQVVDGHLICGTNGGYVKVSTTGSILPKSQTNISCTATEPSICRAASMARSQREDTRFLHHP
jgi:WD40 repeat protein